MDYERKRNKETFPNSGKHDFKAAKAGGDPVPCLYKPNHTKAAKERAERLGGGLNSMRPLDSFGLIEKMRLAEEEMKRLKGKSGDSEYLGMNFDLYKKKKRAKWYIERGEEAGVIKRL